MRRRNPVSPERPRDTRRGERGAAFVEFAVILPFMMLVAIGIVELGTALFQYNTLNKLVRTGARYATDAASVGSTGTITLNATNINTTRNVVVYGKPTAGSESLLAHLTTGDVTVQQIGATDHVSVRATYSYPLMMGPLLGSLTRISGIDMPETLTLTSTVVMRVP